MPKADGHQYFQLSPALLRQRFGFSEGRESPVRKERIYNSGIHRERPMSIGKKAKSEQSLSEKAYAALIKASEDIVQKATQTGTNIIIWRDNRIVRLPADKAALLLEEQRLNDSQGKSV